MYILWHWELAHFRRKSIPLGAASILKGFDVQESTKVLSLCETGRKNKGVPSLLIK